LQTHTLSQTHRAHFKVYWTDLKLSQGAIMLRVPP